MKTGQQYCQHTVTIDLNMKKGGHTGKLVTGQAEMVYVVGFGRGHSTLFDRSSCPLNKEQDISQLP